MCFSGPTVDVFHVPVLVPMEVLQGKGQTSITSHKVRRGLDWTAT